VSKGADVIRLFLLPDGQESERKKEAEESEEEEEKKGGGERNEMCESKLGVLL
jgi:hypothetical protein